MKITYHVVPPGPGTLPGYCYESVTKGLHHDGLVPDTIEPFFVNRLDRR